MSALYFLHIVFLLVITVWLGACVFFAWIVAPTLWRELPLDLAGTTIHKILSKFFPLNYICGLIGFGCIIAFIVMTGSIPWLMGLIILAMVFSALYNAIFLFPRAQSFQRELLTTPSEDSILNLREEYNRTFNASTYHIWGVTVGGVLLILLIAQNFNLR
jgi:hypothetical protein